MRKSFLVSASVLTVSAFAMPAAYAQTAATTVTVNTQLIHNNGSSNTITIDQVASVKSEAKINLNGDSNVLSITQAGHSDFALSQVVGSHNTVTQTFAGLPGGGVTNNLSRVDQCVNGTCDVNATVKPMGNTAIANLSGINAISYILQSGNGNTATTNLSGDGAGVPSANATIVQYSDANIAEVIQTGTTAGEAYIFQGITQPGSYRFLSGVFEISTAPPAQVGTFPNGANNSATVSQGSGADNGAAGIYQGADFNLATVDQAGPGQYATIRQDGAQPTDAYGNNNAKVTQEIGGSNAHADVLQKGQSNKLTVTQSAANVTADLAQFGNLNKLTLTQMTAGASAYSTQTGNSNTATMSQ